jgi:5-methylcytosine-specific restriction endonuclease McrA
MTRPTITPATRVRHGVNRGACSECGTSLAGYRADATVCSAECRGARKTRLAREARAALVRSCVVCSGPIGPHRLGGWVTCSTECVEVRKPSSRRADGECRACGASLAGLRRDAVVCSDRCSALDWARAHREERAARTRAHYRANREAVLAYRRRYNAERDPEAKRAYWRAHRETHREAHRARALRGENRRRARLAGCDVRVILERDIRRLVHRQGGRCHYCNERRPLTREHVIPIARGGRDAIGNLVMACGSCNSSKHSKLRVEYLHRNRERIAA